MRHNAVVNICHRCITMLLYSRTFAVTVWNHYVTSVSQCPWDYDVVINVCTTIAVTCVLWPYWRRSAATYVHQIIMSSVRNNIDNFKFSLYLFISYKLFLENVSRLLLVRNVYTVQSIVLSRWCQLKIVVHYLLIRHLHFEHIHR
jgi:hypothetical protein